MTDPAAAPRSVRLLGGLLLVLFAYRAGIATLRDSVTLDEFVGLPVGLYTLQTGDYRSESMNPPFFRSFAALPLLAGGTLAPRVPPMNEANDWAMAYQFMNDYGARYHQLFIPVRCMVILTATVLAALVFQWSTALYGYQAGLIALLLYTFSPTTLAYGHLITLDLAGALGWVAVAFLTWRFLENPSASRTARLGFVLGIAPLMKLSGLVLPIVVTVLVACRASSEDMRASRLLWWLVVACLVALGTLNGFYGFEGFAERFSDIDFASGRLRNLQQALPWLRLPLPRPFVGSLDTLFVGDEPLEPAYYLAGMWSLTGWWYYHLVAFFLKTPLPFLAAGIFALGMWLAGRSPGVRDYCVFVPFLAVFVANSILNPLNIGVRHALPAYPLMAIAVSPWLAAPLARFSFEKPAAGDAAGSVVSVVLLVWFGWASLTMGSRYLQYFNELAGGPLNGHRWLIDSNVDWGQDLIRLREYMAKSKLKSVHLAYFGRVDPRVYGIDFTDLTEGQSHGAAVVSASFLMGRPYWIWRNPGQFAWSHHGAFTWLQKYPPVARVGSMFVFDLP